LTQESEVRFGIPLLFPALQKPFGDMTGQAAFHVGRTPDAARC
jgi:hypothetical protein